MTSSIHVCIETECNGTMHISQDKWFARTLDNYYPIPPLVCDGAGYLTVVPKTSAQQSWYKNNPNMTPHSVMGVGSYTTHNEGHCAFGCKPKIGTIFTTCVETIGRIFTSWTTKYARHYIRLKTCTLQGDYNKIPYWALRMSTWKLMRGFSQRQNVDKTLTSWHAH